jgi:hypothetical protein
MAERPDAYFRKNPGDVIRSSEWNELQVKAREEIRAHRHTGNEDGKQIARAGIEAGAIDGKLIDPAAEVSVMALTTSGNLTVKGDLKVNGKALLGDIADLLATVKGLQDDKLNRRGDTVSGTLRVQKNLQVDGDVGIGTTAPTHRLHVVALDAVGLFESSGETAVLRLSTKEGLDNRVEIANRPGGRLSLWNNGKDAFNITRNGNVGIGTTTPSRNLQIGPDVDGLGFELAQHASPNVGVIRFGDNTGWKLHFGRSRELPNGELNSGLSGVLMTIKDNGNIGIGTTTPLAPLHVEGNIKVEGGDVTVNGAVRAKALQTTCYAAGGVGPLPMSNDNIWRDVGDLTVSVSLSQPATVLVFYQITMPGSSSHLVTRLAVDNNPIWQTRAITGDTNYWSPSSLWMGAFAAGTHVIKVQYRTPKGGMNNPSADDWQNRTLNVLILGAA